MRTFYIFKINNHFSKIYRKKSHTLYAMLEQISNVDIKESSFAYGLFNQIATTYNKDNVNDYIYLMYRKNISYVINKDTYVIDDSISLEFTKINVNKSNIKVITNKNYPTFFNTFKDYTNNLFVCDFINNDYFWLEILK